MRWLTAVARRMRIRDLRLLAFGVCVAAAVPRFVGAQSGVLHGVVVDSADGALLENVDILVETLRKVARSDASGRFTLTKMPAGQAELMIRRIGYKPQQQTIVLSGGGNDSVKVVLVAQPEILKAMAVDEVERHHRQGIEDFYVRRTQGIGTFITREQLEDLQATQPTEALRNVPGVQIGRTRNGNSTVRFTGTGSINHRDCPPTLWLDGQRVPNMELDQIPAQDIEGIELYRGASTTPAQFWQGNTSSTLCGTIVVWSRIPGA
jgi:TonB-dependent Receptor Plug Domain/Carboxypeptidase regulatory-like domain